MLLNEIMLQIKLHFYTHILSSVDSVGLLEDEQQYCIYNVFVPLCYRLPYVCILHNDFLANKYSPTQYPLK